MAIDICQESCRKQNCDPGCTCLCSYCVAYAMSRLGHGGWKWTSNITQAEFSGLKSNHPQHLGELGPPKETFVFTFQQLLKMNIYGLYLPICINCSGTYDLRSSNFSRANYHYCQFCRN